jgi:bacterioferritin-associated ferredoxin
LKTILKIGNYRGEAIEMILCLCRGVTDREVAEAVERGASTVSEVRRACGAGTECGTCLADIREHLQASGPRACPRAA